MTTPTNYEAVAVVTKNCWVGKKGQLIKLSAGETKPAKEWVSWFNLATDEYGCGLSLETLGCLKDLNKKA